MEDVDAKTETFGQRLKRVRTEKGISQLKLSKLANIHNTHISRYEKGTARPNADTLMRLANALDVAPTYLLEGSTDDVAKDRLSDRELLKRFQELEKLSEDDKDRAIDFLDGFIMKRKMRELVA